MPSKLYEKSQLEAGSPFPPRKGWDTPSDLPGVNRGHPKALLWPAGSPGDNPIPGVRGAQFYAIPDHKYDIKEDLYPEIPPLTPTCTGRILRNYLESLQSKLGSRAKVILKPIACRNLQALNNDIPKESENSKKPPIQHYMPCNTAASTTNTTTPCTISILETGDNIIWQQSRYYKDRMEEIREAQEEGDENEVARLNEVLNAEFNLHSKGQRLWHIYAAVFSQNNLYIFDSCHPNIPRDGTNSAQYLKGRSIYSIEQFITLAAGRYYARELASKHRLNNIYVGGGGNEGLTCRHNTDVFLRNLIYTLINAKKHKTAEDVVVELWSSGKLFQNAEVWPIGW